MAGPVGITAATDVRMSDAAGGDGVSNTLGDSRGGCGGSGGGGGGGPVLWGRDSTTPIAPAAEDSEPFVLVPFKGVSRCSGCGGGNGTASNSTPHWYPGRYLSFSSTISS